MGASLASRTRVDADDHLEISWSKPLPSGSALVFRRRESGEEWRTAPGPRVPIELTPGVWDAYVKRPGRDAERVITVDCGLSLDSRVSYALQPRRREVRVFRAQPGGLGLSIRDVTPFCEVTGVHPEDRTIEIEGWLAYSDVAGKRGQPRLLATLRETGDQMTAPATVEGHGFSATVPVGKLAEGGHEGQVHWDLTLELGDAEYKLAAWLDDVTRKKKKVLYPTQYVPTASGRVRVQPYYTVQDRLAIACRSVEA